MFDSRKNEFLNVDQNFLKDLDPKISLGKEAFFRCNNKDYVKKTTGVMEIIVYREEKNTISDMVERFKELSQKNKEQKVE